MIRLFATTDQRVSYLKKILKKRFPDLDTAIFNIATIPFAGGYKAEMRYGKSETCAGVSYEGYGDSITDAMGDLEDKIGRNKPVLLEVESESLEFVG